MKRFNGLILFVFVILFSSACISYSVMSNTDSSATSKSTSRVTPTSIMVESLIDILPSPIPGDSRIWGVLPSHQVALSEDNGITWSNLTDPIPFTDPENRMNEIPATYLSRVLPTSKGLYVIREIYMDSSLPFSPHIPSDGNSIYYTEDGSWKIIPFPEGIRPYFDFNNITLIPDGQIIIVGGEPNGKNNAWILEKQDSGWKPIPSAIDNFASILYAVWFPGYGLWAQIGVDTKIIHADSSYQWTEVTKFNYPRAVIGNFSVNNISLGISGDLCIGMSNPTGDFGIWENDRWTTYLLQDRMYSDLDGQKIEVPNSMCRNGKLAWADKPVVIPGKVAFNYTRDGLFRTTVDSLETSIVTFPSLPSRVVLYNLVISSTGIIYYITGVGVYASMDLGETWQLIMGKGI